MKFFVILFFLVNCQQSKEEKLGVNISSLDRFLITLSGQDFESFKQDCSSGKIRFGSIMKDKLEERLKTLNAGFIKSLFILQTCSSSELQKKTQEFLGTTVMLFSPQIFFENLLQYKKRIENWQEIILIGDDKVLQQKINLIKDAPTDTPSMKLFKTEVIKILKTKLQ